MTDSEVLITIEGDYEYIDVMKNGAVRMRRLHERNPTHIASMRYEVDDKGVPTEMVLTVDLPWAEEWEGVLHLGLPLSLLQFFAPEEGGSGLPMEVRILHEGLLYSAPVSRFVTDGDSFQGQKKEIVTTLPIGKWDCVTTNHKYTGIEIA